MTEDIVKDVLDYDKFLIGTGIWLHGILSQRCLLR